ncbi:MAG: alpha/beta hydrolase [Crocinitomicaceae bacterium]|nr:alpha/beta hydrolase [Crocinitomicaceae bacterium]
MQAHQIKFPRTAHYYTLGEPSKSTKKFFLVLHGYGQLASQIIHKFRDLETDSFILAPEGFSRFYWNERKGIVGASWMTKTDRLSEIEDYCNYIEHLYYQYKNQLPEDVEINILGFSQGGATAVRWIERNRPKFNNLILWGAAFPTDLSYLPMKDYLQNKKLYVVYGKEDEYISAERIKMHDRFTQQQELKFEMIWFEGRHVIDRTVLHDLVKRL